MTSRVELTLFSFPGRYNLSMSALGWFIRYFLRSFRVLEPMREISVILHLRIPKLYATTGISAGGSNSINPV